MDSKADLKKVKSWRLIVGIILICLQSLGGWNMESIQYIFQSFETFSLALSNSLGYNLIGIIGLIFIIVYLRDVIRFDKLQNE